MYSALYINDTYYKHSNVCTTETVCCQQRRHDDDVGTAATTSTERREQKLKMGKEEVIKQVREKSAQITKLENGSKVLETTIKDEEKHTWAAMRWLRENKDKVNSRFCISVHRFNIYPDCVCLCGALSLVRVFLSSCVHS